MDRNFKERTKWLCVCGVLMAMNVVLSSSLFSVPVPGGHLYLNDIIICTASILLDPVGAFLVGGVGAFLGDLLFYPAPMFVSLVTHGLQAVAAGAVIMVVGYSLGRAFIYSTPEYALLKLPYQILQAVVGAVCGVLLCWKCGVKKAYDKIIEG